MQEFKSTIFIVYLIITAFHYCVDYLNLSHLKRYGSLIPSQFEGEIDQGLLSKTQDYTVERIRHGFISSIFNNFILLLFLFGRFFDIYNSWVVSLKLPFILSGLVFFILILYAETFLSIPFNLYSTFRIEKKYGFSTMTPRLWVMDTLKSLLMSTLLACMAISAGLYLVQKSPGFWWFWVWCFFLAFGIFMMYIAPYVIEPLVHKFSPLQDKALENSIRTLMDKVGIKVSRVFQMDASKRTRHTNAYFTGIGRVKRIVLFDTLVERISENELLSVLAHEAGHWKRRHLLKNIIRTEFIAWVVMYLSFRILQGDILINLFQIKEGTFFAKVVILGFLGSMVASPFTPLILYLSRRYEKEADRFSYKLTGDAEGMIRALKKLSKDNLSNLHPHPLYVIFYYSHPPVLKRLKYIREWVERL